MIENFLKITKKFKLLVGSEDFKRIMSSFELFESNFYLEDKSKYLLLKKKNNLFGFTLENKTTLSIKVSIKENQIEFSLNYHLSLINLYIFNILFIYLLLSNSKTFNFIAFLFLIVLLILIIKTIIIVNKYFKELLRKLKEIHFIED